MLKMKFFEVFLDGIVRAFWATCPVTGYLCLLTVSVETGFVEITIKAGLYAKFKFRLKDFKKIWWRPNV